MKKEQKELKKSSKTKDLKNKKEKNKSGKRKLNNERIIILDFGSQYNQLIARRIRELGTLAEIYPFDLSIERIKEMAPIGIILSGGPSSVYEPDSPQLDAELFRLKIPVLGICYGLQAMVHSLQGEVVATDKREYGYAELENVSGSRLLKKVPNHSQVWMSHGDLVKKLPAGFKKYGFTKSCPIAVVENHKADFYGVQFHPEVAHSSYGKQILNTFTRDICKASGKWKLSSFIKEEMRKIQEQVGTGRVILGLSGGVDSSVAARILHDAIGNQLTAVFVDNGLLRKGEREKVIDLFARNYNMNLVVADTGELFLSALRGVTAPEEKRRIIGRLFVDIFREEAEKQGHFEFLAQGTLYPDVIESTSTRGPSDVIKSHHNRVSEVLELISLGKVVEPLKELFKDEVRKIGLKLGMPEELIYRQPFPGPGLAVRIIGEVTKERLTILREADAILIEEMKRTGWYRKLWQSFAVFLPVQSVGVMGDKRTYENVIALRLVHSEDAMTAHVADVPISLLMHISTRIINEVNGINRVVYDISSKPPATIEWE